MKVSIIIPTINDPHLVRTINETWATAKNNKEIEYIIVNDGGSMLDLSNCKTLSIHIDRANIKVIHNSIQLGRRVSINNAASMAIGEYLFILDAHCNMTKDWNEKLAESAKDKNIAYAVIRDIHPDTWAYRPGWYGHVRINKEYTEKWWRRKDPEFCEVEEESIAFTGCAWMIRRKRFWELRGYDESLGMYGWDGPEWALKTWLNDGKVILRTDVICGHIFGTNDGSKLYPINMIPKEQYIEYMQSRYEKLMPKLIERFGGVPDWTEKKIVPVKVERKIPMGQKVKREIKVNRKDEHVTRNDKGEIIKKVIEYFEHVYTDNGNGPSEEEIKEKYGPKAKKISEEIWELKNGQLEKVA